MKHFIIPILIVLFTTSAFANVSSNITDVTVYQRGARITCKTSFNLKPGNNEIIITDITTSIDANSIQAKLLGEAILLSATTRIRQKEDKELPFKTKSLEDSILLIENDIKWLNSKRAVYEGEAALIAANQKLGSAEEKASVEEIIRLSEFFRSRNMEIRKKIYQINIDLSKQAILKEKLRVKLNALRHKEKKNVGEIILTISSKTSAKVSAKISYLTHQAGWTPIYDVRAGQADKPIDLIYKANVYQTSGYPWKDVKLTISTGNPTADNNRPIMNPWYINFYELDEVVVVGYGTQKKSRMMANSYQEMDEDIAFESEAAPQIGYDVVQSENIVATEYAIDIDQDIPSDGKQHLVAIQEYKLNSKFTYHAIPKLNNSVFLIAKVADYGSYSLLAGQANLFLDGMYIGQSYLNPVSTTDSLLLSLGRDEKVIVKRTLLQDLTNRQTIGSNTKETKAFELVVRNNNNYAIELDLMDQIPIAWNADIEVKIEELGGAKFDNSYGSLLWKMNLKPNETKTVKFVYSIKYPKDKSIPNL